MHLHSALPRGQKDSMDIQSRKEIDQQRITGLPVKRCLERCCPLSPRWVKRMFRDIFFADGNRCVKGNACQSLKDLLVAARNTKGTSAGLTCVI